MRPNDLLPVSVVIPHSTEVICWNSSCRPVFGSGVPKSSLMNPVKLAAIEKSKGQRRVVNCVSSATNSALECQEIPVE